MEDELLTFTETIDLGVHPSDDGLRVPLEEMIAKLSGARDLILEEHLATAMFVAKTYGDGLDVNVTFTRPETPAESRTRKAVKRLELMRLRELLEKYPEEADRW